MVGDERYTVRSASLLAAFATRAMFEFNALRIDPTDPERLYRRRSGRSQHRPPSRTLRTNATGARVERE
jgi:hypothetical protein